MIDGWMLCLLTSLMVQAPGAKTNEKKGANTVAEIPANLKGSVWNDETQAEKFVPQSPIPQDQKDRIEADKLFTIGVMYDKRQQTAAALAKFREAIAKKPNHLSALQSAAMTAAQLDRREEALDYCRRAITLDPRDADRLYLAGLILAARDESKEAVELLERARQVPGLAERRSARYLSIREVLLQLFRQTDDQSRLADVLSEILMLADNPERFDLDPVYLRSLEKQRLGYHLMRADALRRSRRYTEALAGLDKLMKMEPTQRRKFLIDVAETQAESGDDAAAMATLDGYFALGDSRAKAFEVWEKVLTRLGKKSEMIARLEKIVSAQPGNDAASRKLGRLLFDARQFDRAAMIFRGLPADREVLPFLLRTYMELDDAKGLAQTVESLIKTKPDAKEAEAIVEEIVRNKDLLRRIGVEGLKLKVADDDEREKVYDLFAWLESQGGEYELAADFYRKCVTISPNAKEHRARLAMCLLRAEQYEAAIASVDEALVQFPDELELVEVKLSSLARMNRLDEAIELLDRLAAKVEDNEQSAEILAVRAFVLQQANENDRAAEIYKKLVEQHPGGQEAHRYRYYLAGLYSLSGKGKEAEIELLKIVDANPPAEPRIRAGAHNDLGYQWADEGRNLERAEEMIRLAISIDGDNPAYADSLGWVLFKRGRAKEAEPILARAATSRAGNDPVVWDHLGDCRLKLGDKMGAGKAWANAVSYYSQGVYKTQQHKAEPIARKAAAALGRQWEDAVKKPLNKSK